MIAAAAAAAGAPPAKRAKTGNDNDNDDDDDDIPEGISGDTRDLMLQFGPGPGRAHLIELLLRYGASATREKRGDRHYLIIDVPAHDVPYGADGSALSVPAQRCVFSSLSEARNWLPRRAAALEGAISCAAAFDKTAAPFAKPGAPFVGASALPVDVQIYMGIMPYILLGVTRMDKRAVLPRESDEWVALSEFLAAGVTLHVTLRGNGHLNYKLTFPAEFYTADAEGVVVTLIGIGTLNFSVEARLRGWLQCAPRPAPPPPPSAARSVLAPPAPTLRLLSLAPFSESEGLCLTLPRARVLLKSLREGTTIEVQRAKDHASSTNAYLVDVPPCTYFDEDGNQVSLCRFMRRLSARHFQHWLDDNLVFVEGATRERGRFLRMLRRDDMQDELRAAAEAEYARQLRLILDSPSGGGGEEEHASHEQHGSAAYNFFQSTFFFDPSKQSAKNPWGKDWTEADKLFVFCGGGGKEGERHLMAARSARGQASKATKRARQVEAVKK